MSNSTVRGYFDAAGGRGWALPVLADAVHALRSDSRGGRSVQAGEALDGPVGLAAIATAVHLPVSVVRGAVGFYGDLHGDIDAHRICTGTSCILAGAHDVLRVAASAGLPVRPAHCLGHCDRSPTVARADGVAVVRCAPDRVVAALTAPPPADPAPPRVRCEARRAVVLERLLDGACADLAAAQDRGVYKGAAQALRRSPADVLARIERSGLRGRGGAAFPTARKWATCAATSAPIRYVVANGDEGDPGSFIDRELMERDPHAIIEGMLICAHAIGAAEGVIFIRSEAPRAIASVRRAVRDAMEAGLLGAGAVDPGGPLRISVVSGLGSYVCGEETALLNAIEGVRGEVRLRPPYPATAGLRGMPTVVDNVETLVNVGWLLRGERGDLAGPFAGMGTRESPGTKAICLSSGFVDPGVVEVEFGTSLRRVIERSGGGGADGRAIEAVLLGGPMGSLLAPDRWDVPICFSAMAERGIKLGHGGVVAIREGTDHLELLRHLLGFMRLESCGKCVPCRVGSRRAEEIAAGIVGAPSRAESASIDELMELMSSASLCAFGRETPGPVRAVMDLLGGGPSTAEAGPST